MQCLNSFSNSVSVSLSLSGCIILVSLLMCWTVSHWYGFDFWLQQVDGLSLFFLINICLDWLVPVSPSVSPPCVQYTLRSACTFMVPCSVFSKRRRTGNWHGNIHIIHKSSRIIKIMIVATPHGGKKQRHWPPLNS